ncbi:tryptophan synthase subunit alpha [Parenemella sanctibonifatiensis]|uniref:tryptophan synthase subunit alpha n=1 Tax=Parenemella sanctibonifatiensis TaxID=2016505 RepID=UPI0015C5A593|nr:tryptophan synthase subunit alpha [Parenemella sanctibonifatiensis]
MSETTPAGDGRSGATIRAAREEGRAALVGYLTLGYPTVPGSIEAMRALVDPGEGPGVDLVEIGLPYSDPMMDGLRIQRAATTALERGARVRDVFAAASAVAEAGATPTVMTYWNLVDRYGVDAFARDFANAGGAGVITPDLTPDEAEEWIEASERHGLDRIFLVAPSSTDARISATGLAGSGWLYATAVMGVTGARDANSDAAPELVGRIRGLAPNRLVGVGLGVSNGNQAAHVAGFADAVIVGSALIAAQQAAEDAGRPEDLTGLRTVVSDLAAGVRRG